MLNSKTVKQFVLIVIGCGFIFSCNTQPPIEKTVDSTTQAVDAQRVITKDSVIYKSDSSKKVIDSTFSKLKDSIQKSR